MEFFPSNYIKQEPVELDLLDNPMHLKIEKIEIKTEDFQENGYETSYEHPEYFNGCDEFKVEDAVVKEEEDNSFDLSEDNNSIGAGEFVLVEEEDTLDQNSDNTSQPEMEEEEIIGSHFLSPMSLLDKNFESHSTIETDRDLRYKRNHLRRLKDQSKSKNNKIKFVGDSQEDKHNISAALCSVDKYKITNKSESESRRCDFCDQILADQLLLIFHINEKHSDKCIIKSDQLELAVKANINNERQKSKEINKILPGNINCPHCNCIFVTKFGFHNHLIAFHKMYNLKDISANARKLTSKIMKKRKKRKKLYNVGSSSDEDSKDASKHRDAGSSSEDEDPTWKFPRKKSHHTNSIPSSKNETNTSNPVSSQNSNLKISVPSSSNPSCNKTAQTEVKNITEGSNNSVQTTTVVKTSLPPTPPVQQKLQLYRRADGKLMLVGGLLPGQRLTTLPDGTMRILNPKEAGGSAPITLASSSQIVTNSSAVPILNPSSLSNNPTTTTIVPNNIQK